MFPITITINSQSELSAVLAALHPTMPVQVVKETPVEIPLDTKSPITEAAKPETPVVVDMTASEAAAALDGQANKPAVLTYEDAKQAVLGLAKAKGQSAAAAVLKTFGAAKLPEVPSERFAEVIEACKKAAG